MPVAERRTPGRRAAYGALGKYCDGSAARSACFAPCDTGTTVVVRSASAASRRRIRLGGTLLSEVPAMPRRASKLECPAAGAVSHRLGTDQGDYDLAAVEDLASSRPAYSPARARG